jgi:hypothetical protein
MLTLQSKMDVVIGSPMMSDQEKDKTSALFNKGLDPLSEVRLGLFEKFTLINYKTLNKERSDFTIH